MRRRDLFWIGGAMAIAIATPPILRRRPSQFTFTPIPGFDGFRQTTGGAVSGGIDPFFGLGNRLPDQAPLEQEVPKNPCLALFGPQGWGEKLPIAIFSDFNCPYCKVLERRLMDLRDHGAPVRLIWHEMPLLGPSSVRYARAVLASRFLGAEERARSYLANHVLRPGEGALGEMAVALDLLPDMLIREFNGARVSIALADSLTLGQRLGIPGTPGTVIGRTLVVGAISDTDLRALIKLEQSDPKIVCA